MAGISQSALDKIIANNAKTMAQQAVRQPQPRRQMVQENYYEDNDDNDYDEDPWAIPGQPSMTRKPQQTSDFTISESRVASSGLPDKIKNSMVNNPIDVSSANPNNISKAQEDFMSKIASGSRKIENYMNEGVSHQDSRNSKQPTQQTAGYGVDYALIKSIVKECISEAMSQQQVLTENTLKNVVLKDGKIKLYDNSGNVYAAKLEKIGNINDKKKQ